MKLSRRKQDILTHLSVSEAKTAKELLAEIFETERKEKRHSPLFSFLMMCVGYERANMIRGPLAGNLYFSLRLFEERKLVVMRPHDPWKNPETGARKYEYLLTQEGFAARAQILSLQKVGKGHLVTI